MTAEYKINNINFIIETMVLRKGVLKIRFIIIINIIIGIQNFKLFIYNLIGTSDNTINIKTPIHNKLKNINSLVSNTKTVNINIHITL